MENSSKNINNNDGVDAKKIDSESFVMHYKGNAVHLNWIEVPPIQRSPVLRIRSVLRMNSVKEKHADCLLLTSDHSFYIGQLMDNTAKIHIKLIRSDVVDMDFCSSMNEIFVVTTDGSVQRQNVDSLFELLPNAWNTLSFDPLELCAEGVYIRRVCCTALAAIFVSLRDETYVLGSCGDFFKSELQPRHMRIYEEGKELLELVANDEFFMLLLAPYSTVEDLSQFKHSSKESRKQQFKLDILSDHKNNASSLSSSTDSSCMERNFIANVRHLLQQGYALLHTQVLIFGIFNPDVLNTNQTRRSTPIYVRKLDNIGVCKITAAPRDIITRALDGRLYISSQGAEVTEIFITDQGIEGHEALMACCGNYRTLPEDLKLAQMFHLLLGKACPDNPQILHYAGDYTVQNCRQYQKQYYTYLSNLQSQLQLLLKYHPSIQCMESLQRQSKSAPLNALRLLQCNWERMLWLLGATVCSFESYFCGDYERPSDLFFISYNREYIELFEGYTKNYCDIYAIDGFKAAAKAISEMASPINKLKDEIYITRLFQQPLHICQVIVQFMEQLTKSKAEYNEHRVAWVELVRRSAISQELAVNTKDFWTSNSRNLRIRDFCHKKRRVILSSSMVPLKLNSGISMSTTTWILFSDCLCQVGNVVCTYPLSTMWVRIDGDTGLHITTPEKHIMLSTRTHENRKVWLDQLQSSIVMALGRPLGSTMPNLRCTSYEYSRDHTKYANVKAYGTWRKGLLHGNCYLEYPDGKVYYGDVLNGDIEGYGKMVIPSMGLYVGYFKENQFHGHGIYERRGIETYEGNFNEGLFSGHGMMRNNSFIHIGEYQANTRYGYGVQENLVSGDKYMGMFVNDKRAGAGICITNRGDYFEGIFADDELLGAGLAIFKDNYYYEGELTLYGPNGKGEYYMPSKEDGCGLNDLVISSTSENDDSCNDVLIGNKIIGQLSGTWQKLHIQTGDLMVNQRFSKYPKTIGKFIPNNNLKWSALFLNFESEIVSCTASAKNHQTMTFTTAQLWNCISVYINRKRSHELAENQNNDQTCNYLNNIHLGFSSGNLDNLSRKLAISGIPPQETLSRKNIRQESTINSTCTVDSIHFDSFLPNNDFLSSNFRSEQELRAQMIIGSPINMPNRNYQPIISAAAKTMSVVPSFGMNVPLSEQDLNSIRLYLEQAFKDPHHPLFILNNRVTQCFHYSYGFWKVKPTPILAKQAIQEWESISKRIYKFVRKMFPALPEDCCQIESTHLVVSHITLIYPIILSESIYSILFVLYANKYSHKDELYRQNLIYVEQLTNHKLIDLLGFEPTLINVMLNANFDEAVQKLKQLQEKISPKDMLTVIQSCLESLTTAHKQVTADNIVTNADSVMPLTLLAMLRASVPHLGAELALLDDLIGGANFEVEMRGLPGYCYTTLNAAYEHITIKPLQKYP